MVTFVSAAFCKSNLKSSLLLFGSLHGCAQAPPEWDLNCGKVTFWDKIIVLVY